MVLLPRICVATHPVWALPRSLATTGGIIVYFLFLQVLRCFSSLRSPPYTLVRMTVLQTDGLSHSEILGSKVICTYPKLIAAYHVLHRLREPRHPPSALIFLMTIVDHTFSCTLPSYKPMPQRAREERQRALFIFFLLQSILPVSTCQRAIS